MKQQIYGSGLTQFAHIINNNNNNISKNCVWKWNNPRFEGQLEQMLIKTPKGLISIVQKGINNRIFITSLGKGSNYENLEIGVSNTSGENVQKLFEFYLTNIDKFANIEKTVNLSEAKIISQKNMCCNIV